MSIFGLNQKFMSARQEKVKSVEGTCRVSVSVFKNGKIKEYDTSITCGG